jgi:hypothetical protein
MAHLLRIGSLGVQTGRSLEDARRDQARYESSVSRPYGRAPIDPPKTGFVTDHDPGAPINDISYQCLQPDTRIPLRSLFFLDARAGTVTSRGGRDRGGDRFKIGPRTFSIVALFEVQSKPRLLLIEDPEVLGFREFVDPDLDIVVNHQTSESRDIASSDSGIWTTTRRRGTWIPVSLSSS